MASLMADCIQNTVKAEIKAQKPGEEQYCTFTATGYEVKFEGFTALYEESTEEDEEKDGKLPELKKLAEKPGWFTKQRAKKLIDVASASNQMEITAWLLAQVV
jgi:DNA topoisomerase IA